MPKLERISLINAAGFDYLEFPVSGHSQVIGVNGHGKTTLLRTVLFFYLGTNDKAPYALHDTKSDFVSHYLGDPPSYLIYEIGRGAGQPSYHIAVTRPAGRIQFYFVDAPYQRVFYVEGSLVQPIESVQNRLRESECPFDALHSYEEFSHRIYGVVPSPYAVFRPAAKSSGQVGVLARIISGIFTVSQLDADKLKSALTCGIRRDSLATELDLVVLKSHLENFRRVNRAVRTYLRHEQEAIDLVELAEEFERVKSERQRAIGDLVRMAKLLPEEKRELEERRSILEREQNAEVAEFEAESGKLAESIEQLGKEIAILDSRIEQGIEIRVEYETRDIDRKASELESLPQLEEEKRIAEREYASLTDQYEDESQRKERLLDSVRQGWAELNANFQRRRSDLERQFHQAMEQLNAEKEAARSRLAEQRIEARETLVPKRARLDADRSTLNGDFKAFGDIKSPPEIADIEKRIKEAERKQREESSRQERLRSEITLGEERSKGAREKLERDTRDERARLESAIARLGSECSRAESELEAFDASLSRFFQTDASAAWPDAAKTLNRETLFRSAEELEARSSSAAPSSVWGVRLSTARLPEPPGGYDRDQLAKNLREMRKSLGEEKDSLRAVQERYLSEADALEKRTRQTLSDLGAKIDASAELRRKLLDEAARLENSLLTLQSQFEDSKRKRLVELEQRDADWKEADSLQRHAETEIEERCRSQTSELEREIEARKNRLDQEAKHGCAAIDRDETQAQRRRDAEVARIENDFQKAISEKGVDALLVAAAQKRAAEVGQKIQHISELRDEVVEYRQKKRECIDRLPSWESQRKSAGDRQKAEQLAHSQLRERHQRAMKRFDERRGKLNEATTALNRDQDAAQRFGRDPRFLQEWSFFDRDDLPPAPIYRTGAVGDYLFSAEGAHQHREEISKKGNNDARSFLNRFDSETLDRKVLGFSPIYEHFDWLLFVGGELKPFVNNRGIHAMKRIQTQEFEQLIRNICNKNADFREGIRQVNQTAELVQNHLRDNNFVDVLDSIELKVERVDNNLTRTLAGMEEFADVTFGTERDLFGKRADRAQIDRAIESFERLLREIDSYRGKQLFLTDYFDFLIRVHENGHDMGWRRSLDHIGSTGTDYLVKMLIYLSLIEVYRARAIDHKAGSTVHCVLDETGVLAPKYVRSVLDYAAGRGIILITAGHSQQTSGFDNWILVRKRGQRFMGQTVLRKVLKCD